MGSLSDRLRSLGVNLREVDKNGSPPAEVESLCWPIEKVVQGADYMTLHGPSFKISRDFAQDYVHGSVNLPNSPPMQLIAEWGQVSRFASIPFSKVAFLDTETSGLSGGTGTYAFLIGVGSFTEKNFTVQQFFMRSPADEPALLTALEEYLSQFEAIVTFNGKSFDVPLLKTRYLLNIASSPFENLVHIDLLHLARRLWKNRLESRALGDLEHEIMGFAREQEDVPGYLIPQIYFDYLRTDDARPLANVFYHNRYDIVSLAVLFGVVSDLLEHPTRDGLHSLDVAAIARLYEDLGRYEEASELYERALSTGLPHEFFLATLDRFAQLRRRQGQVEQAALLWIKAADHGHLPALIELCKYYEHTRKEYETALQYLQKCILTLGTLRLPRYQVQIYQEDFERRRKRITVKLAKTVIDNKKG